MNILNEFCFKREKYMRIPTQAAKELYFYAQWAGEFECKKNFYICRNHLNSYLVMYTTAGSGTLNYEGNTYVIKKGSVVLLNCNMAHEYFTQNEPWTFKYIHFDGNLSEKYYSFINRLYGASVFFCNTSNLGNIFDKVISETKNLSDEALVSEHIYRIITALICNFDDSRDSFNTKRIMDYISDNYMEAIDVSSIAEAFNFSRSYFTVQFKAATGFTPYDYLVRCRISAAKQMLLNTNTSINGIAELCGFGSCSAFIRTFKAKTGISPLSYKKGILSVGE